MLRLRNISHIDDVPMIRYDRYGDIRLTKLAIQKTEVTYDIIATPLVTPSFQMILYEIQISNKNHENSKFA